MRESMIKAKFKGKLPSLGYWPRKKYLLRVYRDGHWRGTEMFCWIERMDGKGKCPYATRESFRKNWEHMGGLFPTGESENDFEGLGMKGKQ